MSHTTTIPTTTSAVCIDAEGTYGDVATVWYHGTLAECTAWARRGGVRVMIGSHLQAGDKIYSGELRDMLASGYYRVLPHR